MSGRGEDITGVLGVVPVWTQAGVAAGKASPTWGLGLLAGGSASRRLTQLRICCGECGKGPGPGLLGPNCTLRWGAGSGGPPALWVESLQPASERGFRGTRPGRSLGGIAAACTLRAGPSACPSRTPPPRLLQEGWPSGRFSDPEVSGTPP